MKFQMTKNKFQINFNAQCLKNPNYPPMIGQSRINFLRQNPWLFYHLWENEIFSPIRQLAENNPTDEISNDKKQIINKFQ
jgi:hypothetical protein